MTEIYLSDGRKIEKNYVTVKLNGWVKSYEDVKGKRGNKGYVGLTHYPPQEVDAIHGEVAYEQTGGI